jgi:predicted RNA binding protein YcfA (HicA-like mRNA interferase family)
MNKHDKLLSRLFERPKDFKWRELQTLLSGLGYKEKSGSGSRVKFYHPESKSIIALHRPHPGNIVKAYAVNEVIDKLKQEGIEP